MPNYADFLADVVRTGSVMGIKSGASITDIERAIGSEGYIDDTDKRKRFLRRDYGLVEFALERDESGEWRCRSAKVQVHRLKYDTQVPEEISHKYGRFPEQVATPDLVHALGSRGIELEEIKNDSTGYKYYRTRCSDSRVITENDETQPETLSSTIWSISAWWTA